MAGFVGAAEGDKGGTLCQPEAAGLVVVCCALEHAGLIREAMNSSSAENAGTTGDVECAAAEFMGTSNCSRLTISLSVSEQIHTQARRFGRVRRCIACVFLLGLAGWLGAVVSQGQTCQMQSQMKAADRDALANVGRQMAGMALAGNTDGLKALATEPLQKDFDGVAHAVADLKGDQDAAVAIRNLYLLDDSTAAPGEDSTQFYCGLANAPEHVSFTLPDLKPGRYALIVAHATGIPLPRQLSFVVQEQGGWKLAGVIIKPLTAADHDGLWYWQQARDYAKKHELWNAYLYLETAKALLMPVGFLSSQNSEKLQGEQQADMPVDWPTQGKPLQVTVGGKPVPIIGMRMLAAEGTGKDITLIISYNMEQAGGNAAASSAVQQVSPAVAQALVSRLPELRSAFSEVLVIAVPPSTNGEESGGYPTTLPMKSL